MNIGSSAPNLGNSRQSYHSSATVPLSSQTPNIVSLPSQTPQVPSLPLSSMPTSVTIHNTPDSVSNSNRVTNLVKPSSFFTPPSSALMVPAPLISSPLPTAPALHSPLNLQRPYGIPVLQPFPPPNPPPSLTPSSPTTVPVIHRDKVRDALLMLVQVFPPSLSYVSILRFPILIDQPIFLLHPSFLQVVKTENQGSYYAFLLRLCY